MSFGMLQDEEILICDSVASGHSTNCITGVSNQRESGSASIDHTGGAVRATKTIDLPGTFVTITEASNQRESGSASIRHTGKAVRATNTIDLSGTFVTQDGNQGKEERVTNIDEESVSFGCKKSIDCELKHEACLYLKMQQPHNQCEWRMSWINQGSDERQGLKY